MNKIILNTLVIICFLTSSPIFVESKLIGVENIYENDKGVIYVSANNEKSKKSKVKKDKKNKDKKSKQNT